MSGQIAQTIGLPSQNARRRVLYLGSFLDESIVAERGLRSQNAAGSNRIMRLSRALRAAGYRPIVLSPATSLRAVRRGGPVLHPAYARRNNDMVVVYAAALNVPGLNILTSLMFQVFIMIRLMRRPLAGGVVYNFSPGLVLLTAWLAITPNLRILHNIEDVSMPRLRDWSWSSEIRPVRQLVTWICMNLIARMSDAYVVPTRRFLSYLPRKRCVEVITGCIDIPPTGQRGRETPPMRVLYAGKIEREHGIMQFVEALVALDATPAASQILADISGVGPMSDWVDKKLQEIQNLKVTHHGFLSGAAYRTLLSEAHVCVALQDPKGRNANFKTPSKIYEFLGYGKTVIATDVGDVCDLPDDIVVVLAGVDAEEIAAHLKRLSEDPAQVEVFQKNALRYAIANFSYRQVGHRLGKLLHKEHS